MTNYSGAARFNQMIDKKLKKVYYQAVRVWRVARQLKSYKKSRLYQKKVIATKSIATKDFGKFIYHSIKKWKILITMRQNLNSTIGWICFMCPILSLKETYVSTF